MRPFGFYFTEPLKVNVLRFNKRHEKHAYHLLSTQFVIFPKAKVTVGRCVYGGAYVRSTLVAMKLLLTNAAASNFESLKDKRRQRQTQTLIVQISFLMHTLRRV